jgi:hypothetical protein
MSYRYRLLMLSAILVAVSSLALALYKDKAAATSSGTVVGRGCVEAGVEPGCLIATDMKTHEVYNLFFKSKTKPSIGTAISFQSSILNSPTTCMQGQPIQVEIWTKLMVSCRDVP